MDTSAEKPTLGKVLVIGGCGFLGSHIVDGLASYDAQVSILDFRCGDELNRNPNVVYYDADITKLAELLPVFEKGQFDLVIHNVSPLFLVASNDDFERVNIGGTKNIIEAAQRTGVKGLVYTSTAIIIQNNFYMPIDNADETWPVFTGEAQEDDYARSKAAAEAIVLGANGKNGLLTCALRPSGIFGERDTTVMSVLVEIYEAGQHHFQIGDNTCLRDWIYVGDLARMHIAAAAALLLAYNSPDLIPENKKVAGEAFFVTGEDPVPFWDFASAVWTALGDKGDGLKIQISMGMAIILAKVMQAICGIFGKESALTVKNVYACCQTSYFNNTKAKERLGFKAAMPKEVAIAKACKWFVKNQDVEETVETV